MSRNIVVLNSPLIQIWFLYSPIWSRRRTISTQSIKRKKVNWTGHILLTNYLLQPVIEGTIKGMIEVTERRGWRRKQLLDNLKKKIGYWKFKKEALVCNWHSICFGRGYRPVIRQTTELIIVLPRATIFNFLLYSSFFSAFHFKI